ncbi:MAG: RdgB/HAM1 family non-canonical purine NTP pyrophosphatase [Desulfovibrionaceae bacterium]|nr:RdgB/HAM1 family non-canonical purine NTP pyrophosphatase [Desulfovibrionaceae bacterium]
MHQERTMVLATRNKGKIRELAEPLKAFGIRLLGLDDFPEIPEIAETGLTFEENSLIKASFAAKMSGLPAIADDSGLEVDALDGAPGVFSARYGEDEPTDPAMSRDDRNIRKLLRNLQNVSASRRSARFRTVMTICLPNGTYLSATGVWEGRILEKARGTNGFGYDPVFLDPELGCSAAELSREEKNARSHRGKALRRLLEELPGFLSRSVSEQA